MFERFERGGRRRILWIDGSDFCLEKTRLDIGPDSLPQRVCYASRLGGIRASVLLCQT